MTYGEQEKIHCHRVDVWLPGSPITCSDFKDKKEMSINSMEEIAWLLKTPKNKSQHAGFVKPGEKEHEALLKYSRPSWYIDD